MSEVKAPDIELHGGTLVVDGIRAESDPRDALTPSVTFLPERFVRRDTECLAHQITEGADAGKWEVIDDRGRKFLLSDEDFNYEYEENRAHGGPGKINILLPGINALGCKAVIFGGNKGQALDEEMNEWFQRPEHFGLAVADMKLMDDNRAIVFVTRPLSEREVGERAEVGGEVRAAINAKHEKALAQQAEAIVAATKAEREARENAEREIAELKRLAPIAKRHLENCKKGA